MKPSAAAVRVLVAAALYPLLVAGCRQKDQSIPPPRDDFSQRTPKRNTNRPNTNNGNANNGGTRLPNGGLPNGDAMRGSFNLNAPQLPDPNITPGDTLDVTAQDIAVPGYSKKVRNVTSSVKKKAYLNYGITRREKGEYEVDHLISLQLGGSNSIRNLWPQSYQTQPWNAYIKDALENKLHDEVVDGRMDLATAQKMISTNWIAAYQKLFNTQLPLKKHMRDPSGRRLYKSAEGDTPDLD